MPEKKDGYDYPELKKKIDGLTSTAHSHTDFGNVRRMGELNTCPDFGAWYYNTCLWVLEDIKDELHALTSNPLKSRSGQKRQMEIEHSNTRYGGNQPQRYGRPDEDVDALRQRLEQIMKAWVQADYGRITDAYRYGSIGWGWEGWAQVELAIAINKSGTGWSAQREIRVYVDKNGQTRERVDFVVKSGNDLLHVIELKCELPTTTQQQFNTLTATDFTKVTGDMNPQHKAANRWAVAICVSDANISLGGNWHGFQDNNVKVYYRLVNNL
ncbi:hypothetical protein DFH07DRAFT_766977 [Mycena maculata]|uniref:Uncharacterized protein n=1 Tax=Mycena maculata TaxID=230809 RepID=A0AAD7NU06_9AGAR|nr:hypothetical protein DFH07DRAFT_766977 [Mycena maculata]